MVRMKTKQRTVAFTARLKPHEYEHLKRAADEAGETYSQFARRAIRERSKRLGRARYEQRAS